MGPPAHRRQARFPEEIESELNAAKVVLVAWSKTSIASHWVADEAGVGRDTGRLLPISLDGSIPPLGFRQFQGIDFSNWTRDGGTALQQLTGTLGKLAAPSVDVTAVPKINAPTRPLFKRPLVLGGIALAALVALAMAAMNLIAPSQSAGDSRLTAFFGFTTVGDDPAVATMAADANAETYKTFAALGLETASEASTSGVPLSQQLETAVRLNARYAVGGEVRKSASGFDISLRIDDIQRRMTLWRETLSGGERDTVTLPVSAAEQASGTIRCLIRIFKDTSHPGDALMAALPRACASRRLASGDRVQAWRTVADLAPDSPAVLTMLASSLAAGSTATPLSEREEMTREAAQTLSRALKIEPGLRDAQVNLALMEASGNAAEYNKRLAEIPAALPGDVEPVEPEIPEMLRGTGLLMVGRFADAIPLLRRSVQANPLALAPHLWLSMSLMENGQVREGRAMYERVILRSAAPTFWGAWATQELSDPAALGHALDLAPPGISADTTDCLRSLAVTLAEKRPEVRARRAGADPICVRRLSGGGFLVPVASALGNLDEAFAAVEQAGVSAIGPVYLQLTVARPLRADPRFLPLMKKSGAWQYWLDTKTLPDWCKLPEEQGFETCVSLRTQQAN